MTVLFPSALYIAQILVSCNAEKTVGHTISSLRKVRQAQWNIPIKKKYWIFKCDWYTCVYYLQQMLIAHISKSESNILQNWIKKKHYLFFLFIFYLIIFSFVEKENISSPTCSVHYKYLSIFFSSLSLPDENSYYSSTVYGLNLARSSWFTVALVMYYKGLHTFYTTHIEEYLIRLVFQVETVTTLYKKKYIRYIYSWCMIKML